MIDLLQIPHLAATVPHAVADVIAQGGQFTVKGDPNAPGAGGFQKGANAVFTYVGIAILVGALVSLASWATGAGFNNDRMAQGGKAGLGIAIVAAFVLGIIAGILNFAYSLG